ncbi:lysozyme-like protein [Asbolus verrucosus]|uniref:Lysozyme-like protein n=1 Tax=Asbolus verrucosus TaxID=1661398 RepID=A0A482VSF5_ASBVE|nr:lysozyme-like protein [Asbolus verrucosus]
MVKNVTSATVPQETTTIDQEITTLFEETTTDSSDEKFQLDPVFLDETGNTTMNRTTRQKESNEENDVEVNGAMNDKEKENQESDEEEEEPDMITGLISAFLGGLSRPDGSVDVEAITGLLGSLSTQNEDGSYDFNGLTELLMSFFGGGGEEGGGSDFGAFLGGLLGAFIKGVANPPGAKGSGIFVGNLLTGVLPALSGPAPTEESSDQKPQPPLDSGGFLGGLLQSLIGSIGSLSGGGSDSNGMKN